MKMPLILAAAALLAAGCNQQRQAANDQSRDQSKDTIQKSARDAKAEIDKEAKAKKEISEGQPPAQVSLKLSVKLGEGGAHTFR